MKIYTGGGDNMETDTMRRRIRKDDIIIECLGTIDELSAAVMLASHYVSYNFIKNDLTAIIVDLRKISAVLVSEQEEYDAGIAVEKIEKAIDCYQSGIKPLKGFVLPGETLSGSYLHLCRTIARRFERRLVTYALDNKTPNPILKYANRLSDLLFVMARYEEEHSV